MPAPLTHLFWVDLETTGSHVEDDFIIEAAAVITNVTLDEIASWETVIKPAHPSWMDRLEKSEYVRNMHVKNGLVGDILAGKGMSLREADAEFLALLETHSRPHQIALAGSGVKHFDRKFIADGFPRTNRFLTYYEIDVGGVRRFFRDVSGRTDLMQDVDDKPHRAMGDIRMHVDEARHYQQLIQSIP